MLSLCLSFSPFPLLLHYSGARYLPKAKIPFFCKKKVWTHLTTGISSFNPYTRVACSLEARSCLCLFPINWPPTLTRHAPRFRSAGRNERTFSYPFTWEEEEEEEDNGSQGRTLDHNRLKENTRTHTEGKKSERWAGITTLPTTKIGRSSYDECIRSHLCGPALSVSCSAYSYSFDGWPALSGEFFRSWILSRVCNWGNWHLSMRTATLEACTYNWIFR